MSKKLIALPFFLFLISCSNPEVPKAIDTPPKKLIDEDFPQKATVAPQYNPQQFEKGQFWVWQNKKTKRCFRFLVDAVNSEGVKISMQNSVKCKIFDSDPKFLIFNPEDGLISKNETELTGLEKSIYPVFYGSQIPVIYKQRKVTDFSYIPILKLFNIKGTQSWFIDMPGTFIHGTLFENESLKLISVGTTL